MNPLIIADTTVVTHEVPDEISLAFTVAGCPLRCKGCHSQALQQPIGDILTQDKLQCLLHQYAPFISCVLFLGGEWQEAALLEALITIKQAGLKTALYSGHTHIKPSLEAHLDYLKLGPYIEKLGGLQDKTTNQRFYHITPSGRQDQTARFYEATV